MVEALDPRTGSASASTRPGFIVWKGYQRRPELLAPLIGCEAHFFPHVFHRKVLRPLDYCFKFILTLLYLVRVRPPFVFFQAPPLFGALAAMCTKTPYLVDVHNALVQSPWSRIPLNRVLIRHAEALIAHNVEMEIVLKNQFPTARVFMIPDPIQVIGDGAHQRDTQNFLFICSFDRDEPLRLMFDAVTALPEFTFTITADIRRLPRDLKLAFEGCANVRLTGFLTTDAYQSVLCSSKAAVVLSTLSAVQPSGACEALASDTPLILTRTRLTEKLFGDWAVLVENSLESLVAAMRSLGDDRLNLNVYRKQWNQTVMLGVGKLEEFLHGRAVSLEQRTIRKRRKAAITPEV